MIGRPPKSPLFPNTTPSRSREPDPLQQILNPPAPFGGGVLKSSRKYAVEFGATICSSENLTSCAVTEDRKSTRLNSSHQIISYAVFCLKKKKTKTTQARQIN